jgi:hypothetical protein
MKKYSFRFLILLSFSVYGLVSCTDKWDTYYNQTALETNGQDLFTTIKADSTLSKFARMLEVTHYDKVLASSSSFTVFAPTNTALIGYNVEDSAAAVVVVTNHIAISSEGVPAGGPKMVSMLNRKYISFQKSGDDFIFGDFKLIKKDILCKNGVLHSIDGVVPFFQNIYQALQKDTALSTVYKYFKSYEIKTYDLSKSIYLGVNDKGQKTYDTLWTVTNFALKYYGRIDLEDSVYTCVVPTNDAYKKAFNLYSPYFVTMNPLTFLQNKDTSDLRTKAAVMSDLIFRKKYTSIASMPDTIKSTGRNGFIPSKLLLGAGVIKAQMPLSNGYMYIVNELDQDPLEKFYKNITEEAESVIRSANTTTAMSTRSIDTDIFAEPVSSGKYIFMEPINVVDNSSVIYTFSNVLSAKYDIYCVVVPTAAENPLNVTDSTRLSFRIDYYAKDAAGKGKLTRITSPSSTYNYGTANYFTSPTHMKELLMVKGFKFPFSNADVKIQIATSVANSETAILSRKVRIDRILLKPSVE